MNIKIESQNIKSFIAAGRNAQGPDSKQIHFLDSDIKRFLSYKNPLFQDGRGQRMYFTALLDGKPVARVTAHIHHLSNEKFNEKRGCFGFFESINNADVVKALFIEAEAYLKSHGCTFIMGNFNLTAMQKIGVITDGFEHSPFTDQNYSQDYYPQLLEKYGFEKTFPMSTFRMKTKDWNLDDFKSERTKALIENPDVQIADIKKNNLKESLETARKLLNDGFEKNPMFVSVSKKEFAYQAKDMARILDTRIAKMIRYKGKPVGVLIAIPDIDHLLAQTKSKINLKFLIEFLSFKKNNKRAIIIFYSVSREHHNKGFNGYLLYEFVKSALEAGYEDVGATWIADVNKPSLRQIEKLKGSPLHRLSLYKKDIL